MRRLREIVPEEGQRIYRKRKHATGKVIRRHLKLRPVNSDATNQKPDPKAIQGGTETEMPPMVRTNTILPVTGG
jgi:hypothetical protein